MRVQANVQAVDKVQRHHRSIDEPVAEMKQIDWRGREQSESHQDELKNAAS